MKTRINNFFISLFFVLAFSFYLKANDNTDFRDKFYKAKSYLAGGTIDKALPLFLDLYNVDSTNSNISYLIGVCYTELKSPTLKSIYYLERGAGNISVEYNPGAYLETSSPIFTWYYLTIAYSQNDLCEKARSSATKFKELYGSHKNDFYTNDATSWADRCRLESKEQHIAESREIVPISEQKIVTKNVVYETKSPLYAVQIGAFSRLVPIWRFDNLSNVDAFMDKQGMIRYVIGHFTYVSQANILLKAVWKAGYKDAFIVDINSIKKNIDQRYKESVVSVDDVSFKAKISGKVDFRVQIGAFKESIPDDLVQLYLKLEGIKENMDDNITSLTIGSFDNYEEASLKRRELMEFGIPGAFIVAYNYNRKIPVDEANYYLTKNGNEAIVEETSRKRKLWRKKSKQ